ncbi:MAG: sterol desaturase family protein [Rhizobiales bacterium]|nr:sterol desaturase family protein [Hyphomicrobiales bacterium]MBI3674804.1 sterol desaturase family protein [Hyphomicrobiales bacterium]
MRWSEYWPLQQAEGTSGLRHSAWSLLSTNPPAWVYFLDFAVYPGLILVCTYDALMGPGSVGLVRLAALALAGYGIWTFAEYVLHRAVFHHVPGFRHAHFAHHHAPRELIGTPTLVSTAIFAVAVYVPLVELLGRPQASALSVGLLAGYLAYISVHYLVHHSASGGLATLRRLKRHHALHHHRENRCNFGVTTRLWDRMFGTLR